MCVSNGISVAAATRRLSGRQRFGCLAGKFVNSAATARSNGAINAGVTLCRREKGRLSCSGYHQARLGRAATATGLIPHITFLASFCCALLSGCGCSFSQQHTLLPTTAENAEPKTPLSAPYGICNLATARRLLWRREFWRVFACLPRLAAGNTCFLCSAYGVSAARRL